jgi:hypothetical protein
LSPSTRCRSVLRWRVRMAAPRRSISAKLRVTTR